jgi:glyoxylate reductase
VKWIAHNGAGYDPVDVHACKARGNVATISGIQFIADWTLSMGIGIYLSNTPTAVNDATATTALYLMLATLRQYTLAERSLRDLTWKPNGIGSRTRDITGKTLAILGLGGIGMRLAELAHVFPMRVIYHSRRKNPDAEGYEYFEDVEEMLRQADVLSIHVPLRSETIGLVSERWIRMMKPGAIIINTARGKIIDEEAMIRALDDGHVCSFLR